MPTAVIAVHAVAQKGFGTGTNELYDRARPSYQSVALAHIRSAIRGSAPLNIVEIGSGTGIFTRALLAHPDWSHALNQLKAFEPSEGMRQVFSETVHDNRVTVSEGTFDATNVEDGWADLVVVAQAFHWCPDYEKAAIEFSRILKPTGIVALIWNLEDRDAAGWIASLRDRVERHEAGTPQYRLQLWRQTFDKPAYLRLFTSPPEEHAWEYTLPGTRDLVIDRASSKSYITMLPEAQREQLRRDIGEIVDKGEGLVWRDQAAGVFEYPYKTTVVTFNKK